MTNHYINLISAASGKTVVIVDIDGTVTMPSDKGDGEDWHDFFGRAEPNESVIDLVNSLYDSGHRIVYLTSRMENARDLTMGQLDDWGAPLPDDFSNRPDRNSTLLLMRPDSDESSDTDMKPRLLREQGIDLDDVLLVLEDRNSMVEEWRRLGLVCLQTDNADF